MNHKCPYCNRKIKYSVRLLEHGNGEHKCSHCEKVSNISQNKQIWSSLIVCILVSAIIMIFYLVFGDLIQDAYRANGGLLAIPVALFFGKGKIVKWVIWEMLPFAVFFFMSPKYMEFIPLKKYMEQTATKIDLSVPISTEKTVNEIKSGLKQSRVIPEEDRAVFTGDFEDISSSSVSKKAPAAELEKTKSFDVSQAVNITPEKTSKSAFHTSQIPLKKIDPSQRSESEATGRTSASTRIGTAPSVKNEGKETVKSNYSANRKF